MNTYIFNLLTGVIFPHYYNIMWKIYFKKHLPKMLLQISGDEPYGFYLVGVLIV